MSTPPTVPIFSPDGQLGDVPYEQMHDAVKSGGKIAVHVQSPDGKSGYVPADRIHDAIQAGGKIVPLTGDEGQSPKQGFMGALWGDVKSAAQSVPGMMGAVAGPLAVPTQGGVGEFSNPMASQIKQSTASTLQADSQRVQAGRGPLYRAGAVAATAAGANVQGMEDAAKQGDVGAVLGHTVAAEAPYVAALAGPKIAGKVGDAAKPAIDATGPARQAVAESTITKLIKPMKNDVAFGKNPAGAIVKEGITANSLEDLGDKVYNRAKAVGQQIDQTLQQPQYQAKSINVKQSLQPIDEAMQKAVQSGNKGLYDQLQSLKQQLTMNWVEDPSTGTIKTAGPRRLTMSPYEATEFKRQVADLTRWTGTDPFENDLNAVKGKVFGGIKAQVNAAVPDVAPLNERYADLASAGKAIERRIPVAARSSEWSLGDIGTALAAAHAGGPAAVAAVAGKKFLSSTYFKTRAAQVIAPKP